jgi:hypothetical protein
LLDERNRETDIRWSAPLSEVLEIAVSRSRPGATVALVAVVAVGLVGGFFLWIVIGCSGGECG